MHDSDAPGRKAQQQKEQSGVAKGTRMAPPGGQRQIGDGAALFQARQTKETTHPELMQVDCPRRLHSSCALWARGEERPSWFAARPGLVCNASSCGDVVNTSSSLFLTDGVVTPFALSRFNDLTINSACRGSGSHSIQFQHLSSSLISQPCKNVQKPTTLRTQICCRNTLKSRQFQIGHVPRLCLFNGLDGSSVCTRLFIGNVQRPLAICVD